MSKNECKCKTSQNGCKCASREVLTISPKELALVLGVSLRQIWRLNEMCKLPRPIKLGSLVKWRISEITEWIDNNCPDQKTWEAIKEGGKL